MTAPRVLHIKQVVDPCPQAERTERSGHDSVRVPSGRKLMTQTRSPPSVRQCPRGFRSTFHSVADPGAKIARDATLPSTCLSFCAWWLFREHYLASLI